MRTNEAANNSISWGKNIESKRERGREAKRERERVKHGKLNANDIVQSTAKTIMEYSTYSNWLFIICLKFIEIHTECKRNNNRWHKHMQKTAEAREKKRIHKTEWWQKKKWHRDMMAGTERTNERKKIVIKFARIHRCDPVRLCCLFTNSYTYNWPVSKCCCWCHNNLDLPVFMISDFSRRFFYSPSRFLPSMQIFIITIVLASHLQSS